MSLVSKSEPKTEAAITVTPSPSESEVIEKTEDANRSSVYKGTGNADVPRALSKEEEKRLYRKIDMKIMPIVTLMYLCSFLDRGNIGNAKLAGLVSQLHLVGNQYNIALTMFFVPYCLFEIPANLVLKKLGPSRWLPSITIVWGIVMVSMGFVKSYAQLVGVRICLGVAESGLFPGVAFLLSVWYPRRMVQYRVGMFYGAATIAGAFSGLLAFAIEFMGGKRGLEAWSWIFILEGIVSVLIGLVAIFVLVDFPDTASFLTPEEREYVIQKKKNDYSTFGEAEEYKPEYIWAAFKDWQVWLLTLVNMSCVGPLYGLSFFLPSIIAGFGFSTPIAQLLTIPPYVFGAIMLLIFAHYSDKMQMRSPFIMLGLVMSLIGFSINISNASIGVKYFGTFFCIAGSYGGFPGVIAWLSNNLAGQYKRGVGMALQIGLANIAGIIASNIFRTQDSPHYILGHGVELMFVAIGFITVPIAVIAYTTINSKRNRRMRDGEIDLTVDEIRRLGDRYPGFRYML